MSICFFIGKLRAGDDLLPEEAITCFHLLQDATNEDQIADLLSAWAAKGATAEELASVAGEMRSRCKKVNSVHATFIDIVGTGGSAAKTFNVSTAAAFVVAGAGLPVAKHGNRAATSSSGSADVLSELGIDLESASNRAEECLNEVGICFMFAPHFHSISPIVGKVRRKLGTPTIFNTLGPLCNPAGPKFQLIGASKPEWQEIMAAALSILGTEKSWLVHSVGLDEFSLTDPTEVREVSVGTVTGISLKPEDFGMSTRESIELAAMTASESADTITKLLSGEANGIVRDLVLLNAAAAIFLAGHGETKQQSFEAAKESLDSKRALQKLIALRGRTTL